MNRYEIRCEIGKFGAEIDGYDGEGMDILMPRNLDSCDRIRAILTGNNWSKRDSYRFPAFTGIDVNAPIFHSPGYVYHEVWTPSNSNN